MKSLSYVTTALLVCGCLISAVAAAEPVENPIVPADAKLELLHTRQVKLNSGLTEGPAAAPDGKIYFTDMPFGKEQRHDPLFRPEDDEDHGLHRQFGQVQRTGLR